MKRIIVICLCIAMSITLASAQCNAYHSCNCKCSRVYYSLSVNGNVCRFDGINANIAAKHLLKAKESHFLNVDHADGKTVEVYKLKKKGEYAISVGASCYSYRNNTTLACRLSQLDLKEKLFNEDSYEGFALGHDQDGRVVLAIFKD